MFLGRRLPAAPFIARGGRGFAASPAARDPAVGLAALGGGRGPRDSAYLDRLVRESAAEDAEAEMTAMELGAWAAYTGGRLRLPDVDWRGDASARGRAPVAPASLRAASRHAEALGRLYSGTGVPAGAATTGVSSGVDGGQQEQQQQQQQQKPAVVLSPGHAVWFAREHKLEMYLVKAMERIIVTEKSLYKILHIISSAAANPEKNGGRH